jgi:hypothetical protein
MVNKSEGAVRDGNLLPGCLSLNAFRLETAGPKDN